MTTWFVDYDGGTNSVNSVGNGDSFATRRKTLNNITTYAGGDTIKVMGCAPATSIGIANWTSTYVGNTTSSGLGFIPTSTTNATPIVLSPAGFGTVTGDVVFITGHTTNTNANGTWIVSKSGSTLSLLNPDGSNSTGNGVGGATGFVHVITSHAVKLTTAVTKNIALCGNQGQAGYAGWTVSANVTKSQLTGSSCQEGGEALQLSINGSFTTGKVAYYTLPSTLDLSGYQQISFWLKHDNSGGDALYSLKLCSDSTGDIAVDTFNLPYIYKGTNWIPFTIDKGSALGNNINSIAFYRGSNEGAQAIQLDNIIACKATSADDSLTLTSLIGTNETGDAFYPIKSINDKCVILNTSYSNAACRYGYGWYGTSGTKVTYKLETIKTTPVSTSTTTVQRLDAYNNTGVWITVSGGWDRTDMSTQNSITVFDGQNGYGYGIRPHTTGSAKFLDISKITGVRYDSAFAFQSVSDIEINEPFSVGCANSYYQPSTSARVNITVGTVFGTALFIPPESTLTINKYHGHGYAGQNINFGYGAQLVCPVVYGFYSIYLQGYNKVDVGSIMSGNQDISFMVGYSTFLGNNIFIRDCIIHCAVSNQTPVATYSQYLTSAYFQNCNIQSNGTILADYGISTAGYYKNRVTFQDFDQTAGYTYIPYVSYPLLDIGLITSDTTTRHTASGVSWKFAPTHATIDSAWPLSLEVLRILCIANIQRTINIWARRTNTGISGRLICKGKQIAGVDNDVTDTITEVADTWEQLSISFTPTDTRVVSIEFEVWGGTTYSAYIDDLSWS